MQHAPYSLGFSTPDAEIVIPDLPVQGRVPSWLRGALLRTTPARFEVGGQRYEHWFDGLAMLYKFAFRDGRVAYANRFLRSRSYTEAMARGKISRGEFATAPCRTLFERVARFFFSKYTDNANISVNQFGDDVVALTETPLPLRFDPETLETLGAYVFENGLRGQLSTAHPHFDFGRRCHYSYVLDFGRQSRYHLYTIAPDTGRQTRIATVMTRKPAYMHSFGMSERYLILSEFPLVVNPLALRFSGKPFIRNYRWEPERGVRFHVVDKASGRIVKSARAAPFFGFHHVNAFEDDGALLIDIVTYPDAAVIDQLYLDRLRSGQPVTATGSLTRFRLDLNGGEDVGHETLFGTSIEFPRIDYRNRAGRPYRYVYAAGSAVPGNFIDSLVRLDLETKQTAIWRESGCYPGEPVFVTDPDAPAEEAGVILSVVLDANRGTSFLLILEASSYQELARAEVPHHIPFGFHGNYLIGTPGPRSLETLHR
jgi:beta,beta-carotene 9',10'-dioxygenase